MPYWYTGEKLKQKTIGKVWFVCKVVVLEPVVLLPVKNCNIICILRKFVIQGIFISTQLNINMNPLYLNQKSALCWLFDYGMFVRSKMGIISCFDCGIITKRVSFERSFSLEEISARKSFPVLDTCSFVK